MQSAAPVLLDIERESASIRRLYGDTQFGRTCLIARRLVEKGVRFVEIFDGAVGRRWDAHGNRGGLVDNHRTNAARTDQAIAALITDLKSRGLLDQTLVVWADRIWSNSIRRGTGPKARAWSSSLRLHDVDGGGRCKTRCKLWRHLTNSVCTRLKIRFLTMIYTRQFCICWVWITNGSRVGTTAATFG